MFRFALLFFISLYIPSSFAQGELVVSAPGPFGGAYGNDDGPFLVPVNFSNNKPTQSNFNSTSVTRDLVIQFQEKAVRPLLETPVDYTIIYVNDVLAGSTEPFSGEKTSELRINRNLLNIGTNTFKFVPYVSGGAGFPPSYAGVWGVKDVAIRYVESIDLSLGQIDTSEYGYTEVVPRYTGLRAKFNLTEINNDLQLSLAGWDIDRNDEVEVFLNGKSMGYLAISENDQYNTGDNFVLNMADLLIGENTIEFFLKYQTPSWSGVEFEKWKIKNLALTEIIIEVNAGSIIPILQLLLLDEGIDPELLGDDENRNGVRDDVEDYILLNYPINSGVEKTSILFHVARDLRFSTTGLYGRLDNQFDHIECAFETLGNTETTLTFLNEITAQMVNTEGRLLKYIEALSKANSSSNVTAYKYDACDGIDLSSSSTSALNSIPLTVNKTVKASSQKIEIAASASTCSVPTDDVVVFFGNGMFNPLSKAAFSKNALADLLSLPHDDVVLSYQEDEVWYLQLVEVFRQRNQEIDRNYMSWLLRLEVGPQWYQDAVFDLRTNLDNLAVAQDQDLQKHINAYKQTIDRGHAVIIVGHSQGNLYANQAWDYLNSTPALTTQYGQYVNVVSVATPASRVAGNGNYTTLTSDVVMAFMRAIPLINTLQDNPINSNLTNPTDLSNHGFTESYLYHSTIADRIKAHIELADTAIACPPEPIPSVVTGGASGVTHYEATLHGSAFTVEFAYIGIIFSTTDPSIACPAPTLNSIYSHIGSSIGEYTPAYHYSQFHLGLLASTTYYYRACLFNPDGIFSTGPGTLYSGAVRSFTTLPPACGISIPCPP